MHEFSRPINNNNNNHNNYLVDFYTSSMLEGEEMLNDVDFVSE
jgi:hypothetical protein